MPKLLSVLRGIKSDQAKQSLQPRPRLPVTPTILSQVHKVWAQSPTEFNHIVLWGASTLCFFGFLRSGEITLTSTTNYNPTAHLSYDDNSVDNATNPSIIQVCLKTSKTDPFRHGVSIYIGKTGNHLCPVMALLNYLVLRGNSPGSFFQFQDGTPLTKARFVSGFQSALTRAGIQAHLYSGYSFRSGAVTTAASQGIKDSIIQTLGRWRSSAYLTYMRIPPENLAALSSSIAR